MASLSQGNLQFPIHLTCDYVLGFFFDCGRKAENPQRTHRGDRHSRRHRENMQTANRRVPGPESNPQPSAVASVTTAPPCLPYSCTYTHTYLYTYADIYIYMYTYTHHYHITSIQCITPSILTAPRHLLRFTPFTLCSQCASSGRARRWAADCEMSISSPFFFAHCFLCLGRLNVGRSLLPS